MTVRAGVQLRIEPRGALIARDGRPFGFGQRMKIVPWPYPSVIAGTIRTLIGKKAGADWEKLVPVLKETAVHGPLPVRTPDQSDEAEQLYLPAPKDLAIDPKSGAYLPLRPAAFAEGEGWDLEQKDLLPAMLTADVGEDFKPAKGPMFWPVERMVEWLGNHSGCEFKPIGNHGLKAPEIEERTHVEIERESGAAKDEHLFRTAGLALKEGIRLAVRVECPDSLEKHLFALDEYHPLGGERRLARFERVGRPDWVCPASLAESIAKSRQVRMILATPAVFENGWLPRWADGKTPVPGTAVRLRLVSVCADRWKPVSGWGMEAGHTGPKSIRRLVPAGSVYFFEVVGDPCGDLAGKAWLRPICDNPQASAEGFGLAVWGVWKS